MREENIGMAFIAITVVLWSTIEVISKLVQSDVPPLTIAFLRFVIGGGVLLPVSAIYARKVDWKGVKVKDGVLFLILSFLGISLAFLLYHKALVMIHASAGAMLISTVPLLSAPISMRYLKEKVSTVALSGILLGAFGIILIFFSEGGGRRSFAATGLMMVSVLCFALYSVLMKPLNKKMDPRFTTPLSLFLGGAMMVPIMLIDGSPLVRDFPVDTWFYLGFLSVVSVGIAYLFYFIGLARVDVARGNSLMYMKPLIASALAVVMLGEFPTPARSIAIVVISVSLYVIVRDERIQARISRAFGRKGR